MADEVKYKRNVGDFSKSDFNNSLKNRFRVSS